MAILFDYEDKTYQLDFSRRHKRIKLRDRYMENVFYTKHSMYPYTTAYILIHEQGLGTKFAEIVFKAVVGCLYATHNKAMRDRYDPETGRLQALKKLTPMLPKGMRSLVWDAYKRRNAPSPKKETTDVVQATTTDNEMI